jgi:hypothetical protein
LTEVQLNWRLFEGAHSIAEYLYHVAGVELYWAHHLGGWQPANDFEAGVLQCTCDSFLNDKPFPLAAGVLQRSRCRSAHYNWHTSYSRRLSSRRHSNSLPSLCAAQLATQ